MVGSEIVEVLYSPVKAFKKIIERPDFKAVIIVLVVAASVTMVQQYVASSKLYLETRMPEKDDWTESLTDGHNWLSSGLVSLDQTDYKMGNGDGNHSVTSSVVNQTRVWVKAVDFDAVNCSQEEGYIELFFWIKWINQESLSPTSGTVRLFSSADSYFESDITSALALNAGWTNTTLSLGQNYAWTSTNSSDWQNIIGIEFSLDWASATNTAMKVDGIFFKKYSSPIEDGSFATLVPSFVLQIVLNLAMNWILWAGIMILVARLFNEDLGRWNTFFVIIGYTFMATAVYTLINLLPLFGLPPLNVPLDTNALNALLDVTWRPLLAYQLWLYIPTFGEMWVAALGAVAIHTMKEEITWNKAVTIAVVSFLVRLLLRLFLGI